MKRMREREGGGEGREGKGYNRVKIEIQGARERESVRARVCVCVRRRGVRLAGSRRQVNGVQSAAQGRGFPFRPIGSTSECAHLHG